MLSRSARRIVVAVGAIISQGCGDAGYDGPTVTLHGTIREYRYRGYQPVIAGAQLCVYQQPSMPCATSDDIGNYELEVPVGETAVILETDSYATTLAPLTTSAGTPLEVSYSQITRNDLLLLAGVVGITPMPSKGLVTFQIQAQVAYITAELIPSSGSGPFYNNTDGVPDASLSGTSVNARGEFADVEPGEYELAFDFRDATFAANLPYGWARPGGGVRLPVMADALTGFEVTFTQ